MLRARESRHILELARDETSSMRWLTDSDSIAGTLQSVGTQDFETIHARFDFDSELFTSRAYQVASRANMIDALTGSRNRGISHNTEISGGPLRDASDPNESSQPARTGIALTTTVDVDSESASDSQSALSQDTITEPQTSTTSLVRATDSDAQLPDFVIQTPETLGLLALQLGELPGEKQISPSLLKKGLPTIEKKPRAGFFKSPARLPLLLRPRQQMAASLTIRNIHAYKPVKILILGTSESGKSTLAKTMRAAHGDIDEPWLQLHRGTIVNNTIMSLKWLIIVAEGTHYGTDLWQQTNSWDEELFSTNAEFIRDLENDGFPETSFLLKIGSAAQYLWSHPYIREVFRISSTEELPGYPWDLPLYLPDCAEQ